MADDTERRLLAEARSVALELCSAQTAASEHAAHVAESIATQLVTDPDLHQLVLRLLAIMVNGFAGQLVAFSEYAGDNVDVNVPGAFTPARVRAVASVLADTLAQLEPT